MKRRRRGSLCVCSLACKSNTRAAPSRASSQPRRRRACTRIHSCTHQASIRWSSSPFSRSIVVSHTTQLRIPFSTSAAALSNSTRSQFITTISPTASSLGQSYCTKLFSSRSLPKVGPQSILCSPFLPTRTYSASS
ncbi:hypothetical protein IE81DRAFT_226011 [Ceraceosorus guamensis]|uniref:Uncharacterized protein n=1 Tax=Ceraceosorus guamensis TaxID=1522189 RepID=A0A316W568_9BASI|nr:hypothetical protein IE81DRAFT_226011 [Ceraceosorus guamensis]PWN45027.1 hypothetical protein IE81DRAFT_226011 [Ceraceosorus guamensis]